VQFSMSLDLPADAFRGRLGDIAGSRNIPIAEKSEKNDGMMEIGEQPNRRHLMHGEALGEHGDNAGESGLRRCESCARGGSLEQRRLSPGEELGR